MDEPPIQHPPVETDGENPFAPSSFADESVQSQGSGINLPVVYWLVLIAAMVIFIAVTVASDGLALPAVVALVAAAVRVPVMQMRLSRRNPTHRPLSPIVMLLVSWCFMLVALFAALIAFMVICVPSAIFSYSGSSSTGDNAIAFVFGVSGMVSLGCFVFLFYLSTKLPV